MLPLNIVILAKGGKTPSDSPDTKPPKGSEEAANQADVVIGVDAKKDEIRVFRGRGKVQVKLFT